MVAGSLCPKPTLSIGATRVCSSSSFHHPSSLSSSSSPSLSMLVGSSLSSSSSSFFFSSSPLRHSLRLCYTYSHNLSLPLLCLSSPNCVSSARLLQSLHEEDSNKDNNNNNNNNNNNSLGGGFRLDDEEQPLKTAEEARQGGVIPLPRRKQRVLVIAGPTAVGKSSLALHIAKSLSGEIISADSVQVYKGLDVGSAKTPLCERRGIPHHVIDIAEPTENFCVGDFFYHAREATECVLSKKNVPIVVGGTGLYLRWFVYGMPETPRANPEIVLQVEEELSELRKNGGSWDDAVQLLQKVGGTINFERNDWYRLRRGLEIVKATGLPPNSFPLPMDISNKGGSVSRLTDLEGQSFLQIHKQEKGLELDYEFVCFFLCNPRSILYPCIDRRCEEMLIGNLGLLQEASWLLDLGILPNSNSASRAIGYRQAMEYLMECRKAGGYSSVEHFNDFLAGFQRASRNYAKRQFTWFRKEPLYQWIDASRSKEELADFIVNAYNDPATAAMALDKGLDWREPSMEEIDGLKTYRTKNRYFVSSNDCSHILEWIKETQRSKQWKGCL